MFSKVQLTITNVSWLLGLYDPEGREILLKTRTNGLELALDRLDYPTRCHSAGQDKHSLGGTALGSQTWRHQLDSLHNSGK